MTAEQERLNATFDRRRATFLAEARAATLRALAVALAATEERGAALRQRAIALAQQLSKDSLEPRLHDEEAAAEALYRESMQRFVDLANRFLSASPIRGLSPTIMGEGFRVKSRFFLHELLTVVPESVWTRIADAVRPRRRSLAAIEKDAAAYLQHMLETNSARLQNDLIERVLESRRTLEAEIRSRLRAVSDSAERALDLARASHAEGAAAVDAALARVSRLRAHVRSLEP